MPCRILIYLLLCAVPAAADGCYKNRGLLKPVEIPGQIAVISHKDGKETLTVWNTVSADARELAWVLPLPAQPEVIEETHPAAIRMLQMLCAPEVKTGRGGGLQILGLVLLLVIGAVLLLRRRPADKFTAIAWLLVLGPLAVLAFIWSAALSSTFASARSADPVAGVRVLSTQEAGNYDTTVISGDSAKAVNDWLTAGGFPAFEGAALKSVDDYITANWVFLCAQLKTTASGPSATHPLTVRFPVSAPVYPMKLTAGAGTVPVDIYFVGSTWVDSPGGRLRRAMTIGDSPGNQPTPRVRLRRVWNSFAALMTARGAKDPDTARQLMQGNDLPFVPEGRDAFLDSIGMLPFVTHFTATFTPESDWSDLTFAGTNTPAVVPRHVTRSSFTAELADRVGITAAGLYLCLGILAQVVTVRGLRPHPFWPLASTAFLAGIILTTGFSIAQNVVFVPPAQVVGPGGNHSDSAEDLLRTWLKSLAEKESPKG